MPRQAGQFSPLFSQRPSPNRTFHGKRVHSKDRPYSEPMRAGSLAAVTLVAAALGGGAVLGIGKGAGWFDQNTRTVVVNARTSSTPAPLPARATSKVGPITGRGFDPQAI